MLVRGKQSIKSQALGNQNSESEILLEGDDDTLSSIEEKDLENLTGNSSYFLPPSVSVIAFRWDRSPCAGQARSE